MRQAEVWDPSKHPPPLRSIPSVHEPARRFQPTLGRCVLVAARRLLPTTGKMHGTSTRQCGILWHFDNENCSSNKSKNAVQQRATASSSEVWYRITMNHEHFRRVGIPKPQPQKEAAWLVGAGAGTQALMRTQATCEPRDFIPKTSQSWPF